MPNPLSTLLRQQFADSEVRRSATGDTAAHRNRATIRLKRTEKTHTGRFDEYYWAAFLLLIYFDEGPANDCLRLFRVNDRRYHPAVVSVSRASAADRQCGE